MKYSLVYLPIAEKDIRGIAMYIASELKAPKAALGLVQSIRKKANALRDMPYMYREYRGEPQNETVYRAMPVKSYIMFYMVVWTAARCLCLTTLITPQKSARPINSSLTERQVKHSVKNATS